MDTTHKCCSCPREEVQRDLLTKVRDKIRALEKELEVQKELEKLLKQ